MARIAILDDNPLARHMLKKVLASEGHTVSPVYDWGGLERCITDHPVDLVLIHKSYRQNRGWTAFNRVKKSNRHMPALLYNLPDYGQVSMAWVVKAVDEALNTLARVDRVASFR